MERACCFVFIDQGVKKVSNETSSLSWIVLLFFGFENPNQSLKSQEIIPDHSPPTYGSEPAVGKIGSSQMLN